jgi:CRP/FNR family transcriptional regulator, anaerobic regulatory protein
MTPVEMEFMEGFKLGEAVFEATETILEEGSNGPFLFTILSGWAMRTRTLENGRRQVLNFLLPGDLIGLQAAIMGRMQHSVEALTPLVACALPRQKFWELFRSQEGLAHDIAWLSELEKASLDDLLVTTGQRSVAERICLLLLLLIDRAKIAGLATGDTIDLPFGQDVLADTIGVSLVHTNKTLAKLKRIQLFSWSGRNLRILDRSRMEQIVGSIEPVFHPRPFI